MKLNNINLDDELMAEYKELKQRYEVAKDNYINDIHDDVTYNELKQSETEYNLVCRIIAKSIMKEV